MRSWLAVLIVTAVLTPLPASAAPTACADVPVSPYLDVAGTHAPSVDCVRWYDLVRGVAPDRFAPAEPLRRDQMATVVAAAIEATGAPLPAPQEQRFDDLDGNVHRDAVERLAEAGIVQGRGERTYDPRLPVPRGQLMTFLVRAWEHVSGGTVEDPPDAYPDDEGHRHEPSIDRAAALGIASGRQDGTFGPDERSRRDEVATFLTRLLDRFVADGDLTPVAAGYRSSVTPLPGPLRDAMTGVSWHEGCPVALDDLRLVELVHVDMSGRDRWGLLVVHRSVAADVAAAFAQVHQQRFPIRRMRLVNRYDGDDDASMAADNTSAFNCRRVSGTTRWSNHAYGEAIDVNPVENPWVRGDSVEPPAGREYTDRSDVRPGMIVRPGSVLEAFEAIGWGWGGDWTGSKDYQHLSASGT